MSRVRFEQIALKHLFGGELRVAKNDERLSTNDQGNPKVGWQNAV